MPNYTDPHPQFTAALRNAANQAIKAKYHPHYFLEKLEVSSGYEVAVSLIQSPNPSKGFFALSEPPRSRFDLTVEAIVLRPEWYGIFSHEILTAAYERLKKFGYAFPTSSWTPTMLEASPPEKATVTTPNPPLTSIPPETPNASDTEAPPERIKTTTYRILRDTELARCVKRMHGYKCQVCGETITLTDGTLYAEAHHIQPLGTPHNGPDVEGNLLCLCPNHHVMMDYFAIPLDPAKIRTAANHAVAPEFIEYHNSQFRSQHS